MERTIVWFVCCSLYLALTPWRHSYFNKPMFGALMLVGMLFAVFLDRSKPGEWKGIVYAAVVAHAASVAAYLITWTAESTSGVQRFLAHFDVATAFGMIFVAPFFCYAVPVVLLVATGNKLLNHRSTVDR